MIGRSGRPDDPSTPVQRGRVARRARRIGESPAARTVRTSARTSARTVRGSARRRADRLLGAWFEIVQTAAAAGLAWYLARLIVGQETPYFAPVAAVISLGLARGQPRRRAVELALGVAVGIAVADVLVRAIGTGTLQIAAVVVLAMAGALLIGAGTILVNQAAISAILVITLPTVGQGPVTDRFFDALIGVLVALALSQVLFPRDPVRTLARAAEPALSELAEALEEVAEALPAGDVELAQRALARVRGLDDEISTFYDALAVARETAWLSPPRRRARGHLRLYADAARQVDHAIRNTGVLARAAVAATRGGASQEPELAAAVATLAAAVRELTSELSDPRAESEARRLARDAAELATGVLERDRDLRTSMIVGQVRATATDLLRGTGLDTQASRLDTRPEGEE